MFSDHQRGGELAGGIALGAIDGDLEFAGLKLRLRWLLGSACADVNRRRLKLIAARRYMGIGTSITF